MGACSQKKEEKKKMRMKYTKRLTKLDLEIELSSNKKADLLEKGLIIQAKTEGYKLDRLYKEQIQLTKIKQVMEKSNQNVMNAKLQRIQAQKGCNKAKKIESHLDQALRDLKEQHEIEERAGDKSYQIEDIKNEIELMQGDESDEELEIQKKQNEERLKQIRKQEKERRGQESNEQSIFGENKQLPVLNYPNFKNLQFVNLPNSQMTSYKSVMVAY